MQIRGIDIFRFRKPPKMATAIGMRYAGILIQFGTVVLISHRAEIEVAGLYFIIFGGMNATYFLAGFGIPDGLVREVSAAIARHEHDRVRPMIRRATAAFAVLSIVPIGLAAGIAIFLGADWHVTILAAIWWLCYATTFYSAQCLLSLGAAEAGAFFYYPAPTLALLVSLNPYLLITQYPSIIGMLLAAIMGAVPIAIWAAIWTTRRLSRPEWPRDRTEHELLRPMLTLGLKIAVSRVLLTAIYWIPTWAAGISGGAAHAAIPGLASRLNNAVAAVMSAIRFIVRPQIVRAFGTDDWASIERNGRLVCSAMMMFTCIALAVYLCIGQILIDVLFGSAFSAMFPILAILLIGNIAESFGSVVDEVLRMTGAAGAALALLALTVLVEAIAAWSFGGNLIALAVTQVGALALLSGSNVIYARMTRGVLIIPFFSPLKIMDAIARRAETI